MPHVGIFAQSSARESLYRVLRAYSNADPDLGYYQGMAFPAALLLAYMPETQAFWAFYHLMRGKGHMLRAYYVDDFKNFKQVNAAWEALLHAKHRAVAANLKKLDVYPMMYTPKWFLTAFLAVNFPPAFRVRAFDRIAAFGTRAMFSLGLAIVGMVEADLLGASMEQIIPILQNPGDSPRLKDWRALVAKWDKVFMTKAELEKLFKKAGATDIS
jgi:hypothetical protein